MAFELETWRGNRPARFPRCVRNEPRVSMDLDRVPLLSFICHDLRHPLTAILAYSETLAGCDLDQLQREDFHQEICRSINRMNDLISLLLESSRPQHAKATKVTGIVTTVQRALQAVAIRKEFRGIVMRYEHEGVIEGCLDPGQLQQVVTNVVLNACEAVSPDSGRIEVKSWGRQDRIEICISDNGPGISPGIHHSLFQPFVSHGKESGTGLGLAIVQMILRGQGGDIYVESTGETGTLFRVVLPYAGRKCREPITPMPRGTSYSCLIGKSASRRSEDN